MMIFIAGTTRSGKSEYAEQRLIELAEREDSSRRVYIATAEVHDAEMMSRVALHKLRRRDKGFVTIEIPRELGGLTLGENDCVLLESLTVWTANEMFTSEGVNHDVSGKVYADVLNIRERVRHLVIVSDDIFSDGASYDESTEKYLRTLGSLHVRIAALADEVIECCAGIPIVYKSS